MAVPSTPPVPNEALEYFRAKGLKPAFDYRDVWREEHVAAFTVAKVTQADVLASIRDSLDKALAEGQSFDTWRKQIRPELEKAGWWGKREVTDPETGEIRETELGSPHRMRTIYEMNMRTARAAGQWERMQRNKRVLPYVLRELGPSAEHRPEHVAWHGMLLLLDDPFVLSHPCPGGWGCKCGWRQVGRVEYQRLLRDGVPGPGVQQINPQTGLPTGHVTRERIPAKTIAPPEQLRPWKNRRTGAIEMVPKGIDPGFDVNPGAVYRVDQQARQYTQKLTALPADIGAQTWELTRDRVLPVIDRDFGRFAKPVLDQVDAGDEPRPGNRVMVVGAIPPKVVRWLADEVDVEPASAALVIRDRELGHLYRPQKGARGAGLKREDIERLPQLLDDPAQVLWDTEPGSQGLLYVFNSGDRRRGKIVVRIDHRQRQQSGSETVNPVTTAGYVQPENLRSPRYRAVNR